jgi:hypothetical protein
MKSTHIILLALAAFGLPAYSIAAEKPVEVQPTDKARDHLLQTCQDETMPSRRKCAPPSSTSQGRGRWPNSS